MYNIVTLCKRIVVSDLSLVLLGAGSSTRFDLPVKKQWLRIGSKPLWYYVAHTLGKSYPFKDIIIATSNSDMKYMQRFGNFKFCQGGATRQESLKNALAHVTSEHVMVTDIARACVPETLISRLLHAKDQADIIVPALKVPDTVTHYGKTIEREHVKLIQTPQLSRTKCLKEALSKEGDYTDDSSAIKANGGTVWYVEGDLKAHKLTFAKDLLNLECLTPPSHETFTGFGFDVHQFEDGKVMMLGGIKIQENFGFKAHSDGDVALHALTDALLGAAGAGDIGEHFPDTDEKYKNADSAKLLEEVVKFIRNVGFEPINCDITIIAQTPKLGALKDEMAKRIAEILAIDLYRVNVKATTTEKLGFTGRKEGVAVQAVANLKFYDWKHS